MERLAAAIGAFVLGLISGLLTAFLRGFMLMLAIDVANDHWVKSMPNLGYWSAVFIAYLLAGALAATSTNSKK